MISLDFLAVQPSQEDFQVAIDKLVDSCVPAPHGRGNQKVYDDSYRLAKELPQNDFSLSLEILSEAGENVLASISELVAGPHHFTYPLDPNEDVLTLQPRLYKLNAYSKDGFFKSHRDTPKGNHHVGTLLIGLPVAYEGGELRVSHAGKEVVFDWGSKCSEGVVTQYNDFKISIPWAFLFSDVEHEVLPVLSGTRVTIAYDIFMFESNTGFMFPKPNIEASTYPISNQIKSALQNPDFLPQGATLAIALSHAYPMPKNEMSTQGIARSLKGSDVILYRDLKSLGLDVSLEAVYKLDPDSSGYEEHYYTIPRDGYEPVLKDKSGRWVVCAYYTSETFKYRDIDIRSDSTSDYETILEEGYYSFENFLDESDGEIDINFKPEVMWIRRPDNTFTQAGSFLAHSNEPAIGYYYAAVTFVVIVPPYGQGTRRYE
ncbi:hypothetical protein Clacol_000140 [Clathrus columnatus]|uniref:Fe2OG dioxygenase domain-containing protein n=1 Tax=Clathrus columnatus TaxID=1419009 RepID=A0AAV4ZZY3_9AGAM|nr:hypothetical protein Clacol_000140 [Clathrus columnatus]